MIARQGRVRIPALSHRHGTTAMGGRRTRKIFTPRAYLMLPRNRPTGAGSETREGPFVTASRLASRQVEKLWGRAELPRSFGAAAAGGEPIGEIWFQDGRGPDSELLVKYLLTREKLSIQVHPDGEAARSAGHRRGKDEAWLVLEAEPGARIGLGLKRDMSPAELRSAIEAGTLEALVDWREAKAGDFYYSPAGTIHALGPGLTLVEIQENVDLTYRLFDYGRERELQVDAGVRAARPEPYGDPAPPKTIEPGREILAEGGAFVVERWTRA